MRSLRTRAVRDGSGDGADFVINGQKVWTSLGHRADWCQLYVRTDPEAPKHKGISCLIVDMRLPGIEARPLVALNGDADFAEVFFHDVRVPADALLGPLNQGWQVATTTLSHERAGAARLYAEMQVRLEELAVDLAGSQINGRPAIEDAATLHRLGEIALRIKYLEVLCQRSISATLHGVDSSGSASLAKTVWGEMGQQLAALAFDALGTAGDGWPVGGLSPHVALADHRRRHDPDQQEHHRPASPGNATPMNLELTDEQVALRDTVRRFMAEKADVARHVRSMLQDPTGTTAEVWRGLAALGTTGLLVPPEYDGAGMTMVEAGIVAEELGAALHPGPWLSCAVAAPRALARIGAGSKAAALLTGIADGSTIATVGPLTGPRPAAVEHSEGVVLRGEITELADLAAADVILVLADGPDGTGLFAVDTSCAGIEPTLRRGVDQTRKIFQVTLADVAAQRCASVSPDVVQAVVDDVIIANAADALGAAQAVLNLAVEYAKTRKQFGKPIGSFQAVQHLCVDMYETVELARSGVIHALWAADAADPAEHHLAAARTKAYAARLATVGDTAIQVFGGIGYTWEHEAHLYLRRLLSWSTFLGGSDQYLEELGAQLALSVNHGKP